MKRLFCALALVLVLVGSSFALTNKEYGRLMSNPEFARADRELNTTWEGLKDVLSGRDLERVKREQRQWISNGRDKAARRYMRDGYSRVEAYTEATRDRIEALKAYY
ncbi:MAG: DUF1311 domain-containing protein [Synergistaceae bacterium]|nr:DUF1311 domain-containing protein [Synergistaceae bacterium]